MSNVDIYTILSSKTSKIDLCKRYVTYINHCKIANKWLSKNFYTEKHHILPKSIWPEYKNLNRCKWNLIKLTRYQHLVAHSILSNIFDKMKYAYRLMMGISIDWEWTNELKKDQTLYQFQNLKTGIVTKPTLRYDFIRKYNLEDSGITHMVNGKLNHTQSWCIYDESDPNKWKTIEANIGKHTSDRNLYVFYNALTNETTQPMTRCEFAKFSNIKPRELNSLFKTNARANTCFNWSVISNDVYKANKKKYDCKIIFKRIVDDFITEPMTRKQFSEKYGVAISSIGALVSGRAKTCNGWKIYELIGYKKRS